MRRRWKFWAGILISLAFVIVALAGLRLDDFWQTLRNANYWWIIPGVAVYFAAVLARTWRWHYMLRHLKAIPIRRLFPVVVIGYMGNNVYPARAGEVLRSYVLKRREGVGMGASLTTVILERLFDGLVMLAFVFFTLPFIALPPGYRILVLISSLLFGGALIFFFAVAAWPRHTERIYLLLLHKLIPERFHHRAHAIFDRFMAGLHSLRSPREVLMIFVASTIIWLTETTKYWFVMHAFPFTVSFPVLMLMTAVVNLATTIPSTPGYIGTFDAPGIAVLKSFRIDGAVAAGYTIVLHAALWLPITLLGLIFMGRESLRWGDFSRALEEGREAEQAILEREAELEHEVLGQDDQRPMVEVKA